MNLDTDDVMDLSWSSSPTLQPLQSALSLQQRLIVDPKSPFEYLPIEIHIEIFSKLNLEDRKRVRLVCKLWNSISSSAPSITKNEKFVFTSHCKLSHISEILQGANDGRRMNLEFHNFIYPRIIDKNVLILQKRAHYFNGSIPTWQNVGGKLVDLSFFQCHLNKETFRSIFCYANDLKTFSMKIEFGNDHSSNMFVAFIETLNQFIQMGIQHTQLHTFNLILSGKEMLSVVVHRVFMVFPCLKEFYFEDSAVGFGGINNDKLVLVEVEAPNLLFKFLEDLVKVNPSFKLLSVQFKSDDLEYTTYETMLHFFTVHKDLESVTLPIQDTLYIKSLVFYILQNCSHIDKFSITEAKGELYGFDLNCEEMSQFLIHISKIGYYFELMCFVQPESFTNLTRVEFAANVVSLSSCDRENDWLLIHILEHGPNVEHLRLKGASDYILQKIFRNLQKLKTLILYYLAEDEYNITPWGFRGLDGQREDGISIKVLQRLEYLEISEVLESFKIREIACDFQFPRLKYLQLSYPVPHTRLCSIIASLPALSILRVPGYYPMNLSKILELCRKLKNLKFLEVGCLKMMTLDPLFIEFTNLKYISDPDQVYWYNRFTKEMCDIPAREFCFYDKVSPFGWSRTMC